MTIEAFLRGLRGVKPGGDRQWTARCPSHDDRENSLSVAPGPDGRILVNCHAGCSAWGVAVAMGLSMKDLFPEKFRAETRRTLARTPGKATVPATHSKSSQTLTLAQLAAAKRLPEAFLFDLGVEDHPGGLGVVIGYFDADGREHARYRLRTALFAKDGSRWLPKESKVPIGIYGEWRLPK